MPKLIKLLWHSGQCVFPAGLLLIDGAPVVRAKGVWEAIDLNFCNASSNGLLHEGVGAVERRTEVVLTTENQLPGAGRRALYRARVKSKVESSKLESDTWCPRRDATGGPCAVAAPMPAG
jgi:hypothetical protein